MSGKELDQKLVSAGYIKAELARQLGIRPQDLNQALNAKDVKTGLIEDLCHVLNKDISFFYGGTISSPNIEIVSLRQELESLRQENELLKAKLRHQSDPDKSTKESQVYELWMEHMKIKKMNADFDYRMQEMYQKILEG